MVVMQLFLARCFASVAFLLPTGIFFSSTLCAFWLMAFFSATFDISADGYYIKALSPHQQAAFVGVRSTFYRIASVLGQGGIVILAGHLENTLSDIPKAWSYIFYGLSISFLLLAFYHSKILPSPLEQKNFATTSDSGKNIIKDFFLSFSTFFQKPHIMSALAFMLLYRIPEALCLKIVSPFLISSHNEGGLNLSTSQIGLINGTFGVIALLAGGILGGYVISRGGLKKWLWPMALSLTLPCFFYCLLAMFQPQSITLISLAIFIEQFGYGFGFSAYMLYLLYFARGENSTAHYAFSTAFMALGMMLPGMAAGWLFEISTNISLPGFNTSSHFVGFFWLVMAFCLPSLFVTSRIKIDPNFGK